ncbi:cyclic GMP-AMP synthase-like receptor [Prorops nasuta]|uniref:cyclic GMP-AMP synthase-like receptor n=1 Tax=Prorops nasuta TaxID=863751 RepID=UPI0034CFF099
MALNVSTPKEFNDDSVLNCINKYFITIQEEEVKAANSHLQKVLKSLLARMKTVDKLFEKSYQELLFVGSFYKGTKVGKPEEFDLDIIIELPINYNNIQINKFQPGYVTLRAELKLDSNINQSELKTLKNFINEKGFVNQEKFRCWFESIISKVECQLLREKGNYLLDDYLIKFKKSGPAFTLCVKYGLKELFVDLVPALRFTHNSDISKLKAFKSKKFVLVPKPMKTDGSSNGTKTAYAWRLSFFEQEKELLTQNGTVKPIIRYLKKLRDTQNWKSIASYYIETIILHLLYNMKEQDKANLNKLPRTLMFFQMLIRCNDAFKNRSIPFFWDEKYNLLQDISIIELDNISGRLNKIICKIKYNLVQDKFIIAKYILNAEEYHEFLNKFSINSAISESNLLRMDSQNDTDDTLHGNINESWIVKGINYIERLLTRQ